MPSFETVVFREGWPKGGAEALNDFDSVVVFCDGGGRHLLNPHIDEFDTLMDKGVGLVCLHYGVETPKGKTGNAFLDWMGGYFEMNYSVNPHWDGEFKAFPDHPISKGVKPFKIHDEWYFHMRFRPEMKGVTPILSAHPPESTMDRPDGNHSGNPHVRASMARNEIQHVAWAATREGNDGRGFGFTGGHVHWNWGDSNFRKVVLNAITWTAHAEVPENGVGGGDPSREQLEENQDFKKPAAAKKKNTEGSHDPKQAVANLDIHPELKATLFAAEPLLLSPSNIDIDDKGRIWVCEIVNYRRHNGKRPEGDRILILEDSDGDGTADKSKVFYQGRDIDSPHGVCVLGNKVIVSAGKNVFVFTDTDGDDKPDDKQIMFTGLSGTQHDHGIHKFMFGPDGKLYFNFGNEGKQLKDPKTGKHIVDVAGNEIRESMKPYQQGMVFRCNMDGSEVETLGWNFRNNWMITVDSFGTLWQSDNDDDGNTGVRINYVMEYGNYGYRDAFTGAGWRSARTGMHSQRALRHWHQNDPGIVPNLLNTGAGSPTGILVYEGDLLPKVFQNQMIHCDAGPSVVRAYPVNDSGAGYTGSIVNVLEGTRDRWFRPADVQAAPDGSLIVADWYDPGVGGHAMGDLDRGRLFRVLPKGHDGRYNIPKFDYGSVDGAVAALGNANNAVRYHAWTELHNMGPKAEEALQKPWQSDNPRMRARALWLLGKIAGRGQHYVDLAIADDDANIRITGLRLARQLSDVNNIAAIAKLVSDKSPQVRRDCAVALRYESDELKPTLWAKLASQHDGNDRWYLEALGIGAELDWNNCLGAWKSQIGSEWSKSKAGRDIVWRSRAAETPMLLAELINDKNTPAHELAKYFRAFDFLRSELKNDAISKIAFSAASDDKPRQEMVARESFDRLEGNSINNDDQRAALSQALDSMVGTEHFVSLVSRFNVTDRYESLLKMAQANPNQRMGIAAARVLLDKGQTELIATSLKSSDETAQNTVTVLGNSTNNKASEILAKIVFDSDADLEMRRQSLRAMVRLRAGALRVMKEVEAKRLDDRLTEAAAMAFSSAPFGDIRTKAGQLFPAPQTKGAERLPPVRELARIKGDANTGMKLFAKTGTCANCHVVGGKGKEVGPDLSEIGSKLSREAMFESIIYPSAGISHNYENFTAVLDDGNVVTGLVTSKTDKQVVMKDAEGIARTIETDSIEDLVKQPISLMPNDISKLLTKQELVDVVEYMTTLKK